MRRQACGCGLRSLRAIDVKLTVEINSLTRRLNHHRNVSLRLNPHNNNGSWNRVQMERTKSVPLTYFLLMCSKGGMTMPAG
jgi:hypothetical protein